MWKSDCSLIEKGSVDGSICRYIYGKLVIKLAMYTITYFLISELKLNYIVVLLYTTVCVLAVYSHGGRGVTARAT